MGAVKIKGQTSGSTTITAPATGGDETIELSTALAGLLPIAGGKILQIVRATDTTNQFSTSTSFVDVTGMSVTITPQKATSAILLMAFFYAESSWTTEATNQRVVFQITDSSNNAISGAQNSIFGLLRGTSGATTRVMGSPVVLNAYSTPATTSPVTYKMRFKIEASGNTAEVRNGDNTGQMYAIEVSA
jgi:hypothetical protein